MSAALHAVTIVLSGIAMAPALAHALELPGKMRLSREQYLAVQTIYYPGFTLAGAAEPFAIVALAAQLALVPGGTTPFWLTAGALAAAIVTHAIYWVLTAPANKLWLKGTKLSGAAQGFFDVGRDIGDDDDWANLRGRWERSHIYRALSAMTAFMLATSAAVS